MGYFTDYLTGGNIKVAARSIYTVHSLTGGNFSESFPIRWNSLVAVLINTPDLPKTITLARRVLNKEIKNYTDLALFSLSMEAAPREIPYEETDRIFRSKIEGYLRSFGIQESYITGDNRSLVDSTIDEYLALYGPALTIKCSYSSSPILFNSNSPAKQNIESTIQQERDQAPLSEKTIYEAKCKYRLPLEKDVNFFRDLASLMNLQISDSKDLDLIEKEIDYISLVLSFPKERAKNKIIEEINEISKNNASNKQDVILNLLNLIEDKTQEVNKESNRDNATKVQDNSNEANTFLNTEQQASVVNKSSITCNQVGNTEKKDTFQKKIVKVLGWFISAILILVVSALARQCGRNVVKPYKHNTQSTQQSYQNENLNSVSSSNQVKNSQYNNSSLRVLTTELPTGGNALTLADGIAYYFDENYLAARKRILKQSIDDNGKKYVLDYFASQNLTPNVSVNSTLNSDFIYVDGKKIEYAVYLGSVDIYEPKNKYKAKQDYTQVIFATFENGKFIQTQCIDFGFNIDLALKEKCRNELYRKQNITITKNRLIDFENKYFKNNKTRNHNKEINKNNQSGAETPISNNPYNYSTNKLNYVEKLKNLILNNWYIDSYMVGKTIRLSFSINYEGIPYDISCQGAENVCKSAIDSVYRIGLFPYPPNDCTDCNNIKIMMTPSL